MASTPFFSIILPTYNRAHLLKNTINSVVAQTFSDWELIVVDDGSTDHTRAVVDSLNNPRIKYVYQENAERSAARNNGISKATGQFVCFLDSDDYFLPEHLQSLFTTIQQTENAIAFFIADVIRLEKGKMMRVPHEDSSTHFNNACFILQARESIIPSRVAIHHKILEHFKFNTALKDVEDTVLWIEIATHYPLYFTGQPTAVYSIHALNSTNLSNNPFSNQLKGLRKIFSDPKISALIPTKVKQEKLSICYLGIAKFYSLKKNYFAMAQFVLKSIVADPLSNVTLAKIKMLLDILPYM